MAASTTHPHPSKQPSTMSSRGMGEKLLEADQLMKKANKVSKPPQQQLHPYGCRSHLLNTSSTPGEQHPAGCAPPCACSTGLQACWTSGSSQTGRLQHHSLRKQRWRTRCGRGERPLCLFCKSAALHSLLQLSKDCLDIMDLAAVCLFLHAASRAAGKSTGSIRTSSTITGEDRVCMACCQAHGDLQCN